jgi:putative ABC transport system permease protein
VPRGRRRRTDDVRARAEAQIDAELEFHRDRTIDELVAGGLSRRDAETEARRRFGPVPHYRLGLVRLDLGRDVAQRRRASMHLMTAGWRAALRDLRRSPGFALGVIAILTLGLGVNAVTFGLVDRLVLSGPSDLAAPGQLRRVVMHRHGRSGAEIATLEMSYVDYRDLLAAHGLAGAAAESASPLLFGGGDTAARLSGLLVTANYFSLLGVSPSVGRFFTADESERAGTRVAVLGHAFWQRQFGGDRGVLGRDVRIGDHHYTVVGVAPPRFTGSSLARVDVFLPLEAAADEQVEGTWRTGHSIGWLGAIVRLAPGVSAETASEEATALYRHAAAADALADRTGRIEFAPLNALRGATASNDLGVAGLVGLVSLLVLLIAIANAANLFLARSLRRRESVALRLALGGGRAHLIGEQAAEGAVLALFGAGLALVVASIGAPTVERLLFPQVAWVEATVDLRLLVLLGAVAVLGGALAAALPMWQTARGDVAGWLKTGAHRATRAGRRTQTAMLVVQGALSVVLLVGAGLFVRSMARAQSLDLGIDADRLLVMSIVRDGHPPPAGFRERLRADLDRIPGVERTTLVAGTLPFVSSWAVRLSVPGLPERPRVDDGGPYIQAVEPGYFAVAGTRLVEGRGFTPEDRAGAPRVAVVNQTMARLYWPGERAIGKCLQIGPDPAPCYTVVGIAENTRRQAIVEGDSLLYYIPLDQAADDLRGSGRLLVRTTTNDADTMGRIAETMRRDALSLDPSLRYVAARDLEDVVAPQLRTWRLGAALFSAFGLLALIVATIGLYSVVAFDVEGRRREMGVRAALGATASSLTGLVVRDGLRAAAWGVAVGFVLAWLVAPVVSGLLYNVPPHDPAVLASVVVVLLGAAVFASAVPALRAGRVDPSAVLREE